MNFKGVCIQPFRLMRTLFGNQGPQNNLIRLQMQSASFFVDQFASSSFSVREARS